MSNNNNPFDPNVVPRRIGEPRASAEPPVVLPQFPWYTLFSLFMWRIGFLIFLLKAGTWIAEAHGVRVSLPGQNDPDTTCSEAYQDNPTKEHCLATNDHFLRPCEYCVTKSNQVFCYNADQAKWSRWFDRAKCEIRPSAKREKLSRKKKRKRKRAATAAKRAAANRAASSTTSTAVSVPVQTELVEFMGEMEREEWGETEPEELITETTESMKDSL
ncbi:expressed unknown protein [Seminavis robusta]|uniref:Uncharacterized protein n=1 Tax=Seminavis robusta TaxID=568900 RepID=A0A9N8EMM1_9STRA|nr:expressed unknown protein [Seminavis robusta]|eukprot:Sro1235_g255060.1 n/a (216) ;mRNA; f:27432-28079